MKKHLLPFAQSVIGILVVFLTAQQTFGQEDEWNRKADFGGGVRHAAVGFSIGHKAYIGTGIGIERNNGVVKDDFWEYDPVKNIWSQKASFPGGGRHSAIGMAIGRKGYLGMGFAAINADKRRDLWEYDPAKNKWSRKQDFPRPAISFPAYFSIGRKGYVGTGSPDGPASSKEFWEFDPSKNRWTRKTDVPGPARLAASGLSIGKKGYLGLGSADAVGVVFLDDFWEYNPSTNKWSPKKSFAGGGREFSTGFNIGHKGFIGLGSTLGIGGGNLHNDFWEYDPLANSWTRKADYQGGLRQEAVGFGVKRKGYFGTGGTTGINPARADFWEYTPSRKNKKLARVVVPATANSWLAGKPDGAMSPLGDIAPANSPVAVDIKISGGWLIEVAHVTGKTAHGPNPPYALTGPEGCLTLDSCMFTNITHEVGAEHGKSGLTAPINSLIGVFLNEKAPTFPAPPSLDFSTVQSRNYLKLYPKLKQVFFIGDGKTSWGKQQHIVVPFGATRFFLGTMDGIEWNGNAGTLQATVKVVRNYEKPHNNSAHTSLLEGESQQQFIHPFNITISPNPFQNTTRIQYELPDAGHVSLAIFDAYGRLITQLRNSNHVQGTYVAELNGKYLPSGLYFYQMIFVNKKKEVKVTTGNMTLAK